MTFMSETMTKRERFLSTMKFMETDRLPIVYCNAWEETKQRWQKEGMTDFDLEVSVYDGPLQSCWLYGPYQDPLPAFEERLLGEDDAHVKVQNARGQIEVRAKKGTSMPFFAEYPVKSRADWKSYKKRFDPTSPGRYPDNWQQLVAEQETKNSDEIRGVAVWGYYGFPREMFGPEKLSYIFYDDPKLIAEMNEFWLNYTIKRLERAVSQMQFDYALIWEDNCYKHGMLHSPKIFAEFMAPHYKKLVSFFNKHNIDIISVDSDGNVAEFIPLLLDVGITAVHPMEVAAGMDVVRIGEEYPRLQIWGGIDKRALARGPQAIDAELQRVLPAMKKRRGYAAGLDHLVPSDVSLQNFRYFTKRLLELS